MFLSYFLIVFVSGRLELEACGLFLLEIFCSWPDKQDLGPAHRG